MNNKLTHAGCIVFKETSEETLFLVISSSTGKHWVLPKGHIDAGEDAVTAGIRELEEEAGVIGEAIAPLPIQEFYKKNKKVIIKYYLTKFIDQHSADEGREIRWEDEQTARELLSFDEAKTALQNALDVLRS